MKLLDLYNRCVAADYVEAPNSHANYALEREGNTLFILLQWTCGAQDWKSNFDFPARPYKDMPITWLAHRGFTKLWKAIEPCIREAVDDKTVEKIVIVGYSQGAALAALAHEYCWYVRPDLRDNLIGFGFEPPRVFCGLWMPKKLKQRWATFYWTRNGQDIVTHVPFAFMGFKQVGNYIHIGKDHKLAVKNYKLRCVNEHDFDNIRYSLARWDAENEEF